MFSLIMLLLSLGIIIRCKKLKTGGSRTLDELGRNLALSFGTISNYDISYEAMAFNLAKQKLLDGEIDLLLIDHAIDLTEQPDFQMLPIVLQPVAITFNLPAVDDLRLTQEQLVGIFMGRIRFWSDIDERLPKRIIFRVVINFPSLFTQVFVQNLVLLNSTFDVSELLVDPTYPPWPKSKTIKQESFELGKIVMSTPYSIGYSSGRLLHEFDISIAAIENQKGEFVHPNHYSLDAISLNHVKFDEKFIGNVSNSRNHGAYPLAAIAYVVANKNPKNQCEKYLELYRYLNWMYAKDNLASVIQQGISSPIDGEVKSRIQRTLREDFRCNNELLYPKLKPTSTGLNVGSIIGISIGAVVGILSIIMIIFFIVLSSILVRFLQYRIKKELKQLKNTFTQGPQGFVAIAFSDIEGSTSLWEVNDVAMHEAQQLHDKTMRICMNACNGYEVKSEGDAFMVAFKNPLDALTWSKHVHLSFLKCKWPNDTEFVRRNGEVVDCFKTVYDQGNHLIFRGFRIRIGIHVGVPISRIDERTRHSDYFGLEVSTASRITDLAWGGQTLVSNDTMELLKLNHDFQTRYWIIKNYGPCPLKGITTPKIVYSVMPKELAQRWETLKDVDLRYK